MKCYRTLLIATFASATIFAAASASADTNRLNVPAGQWLSHAEVIEKLAAQGYTVREIEADDGQWEIEGHTAEGCDIELDIHGQSGDVLKREVDDCPPDGWSE